jgi:hypothetical protein
MIPDAIKDDDFKYRKPTIQECRNFYDNFLNSLKQFSKEGDIPLNYINVNEYLVLEIHERIDKRRDYYHYFHSEGKVTRMSQLKELALLCYWISKYKPLTLNSILSREYFKKNNCTINEMFAYFVIKAFVIGYYKKLNRNINDFFTPQNRYIITYNLMHRDISKESIILLMSSLIMSLEM